MGKPFVLIWILSGSVINSNASITSGSFMFDDQVACEYAKQQIKNNRTLGRGDVLVCTPVWDTAPSSRFQQSKSDEAL
jgi:hypothetical protein